MLVLIFSMAPVYSVRKDFFMKDIQPNGFVLYCNTIWLYIYMKPQIIVKSFIEAPAGMVWESITNHKLVSEWLMETNITPVAGFKGYFKMKPRPGFDGLIHCEVLEVVPDKTFTYSWQSGWMKKPTTIRFTLEEKDNGTLLILEHWGFEGVLGRLLRMMLGPGWKKMLTKRIPALVYKMA